MTTVTMLQSKSLSDLHDALQERIKKGRAILQARPNQVSVKSKYVLAELEYRQSAINEATSLIGEVSSLNPYELHTKCCLLYRKYLVVADKNFAAFISADKSEEANVARMTLVSYIEVFDVDFDYSDTESSDACFIQYIEGIIEYFLFFRERYTHIKTSK